MEQLIDYILSDDFNNRVEAVFGLLAPIFGAIMVCRVLKFIVEFILYPANFH